MTEDKPKIGKIIKNFFIKLFLWVMMSLTVFGLMWLTSVNGGFLGGLQVLVFSFEGLLWIIASIAIATNKL